MSAPQREGRFNLSSWALRHQALVVFLVALATLFGALSYTRLSQSEDPPFTFRVMVVQTFWPGATARVAPLWPGGISPDTVTRSSSSVVPDTS